ncbi:MAG: hypothetical protein V3T14_00950 [Myxococcota bacterium]
MGRITLAAVLLLLAPQAAGAADADRTGTFPQDEAGERGPRLDLDRLLQIPVGAVVSPERWGGKDRAAWELDFREIRKEVQELEGRIADTQHELREAAPGDWAFSATGAGAPTDPEVLRLRAELRRDRQSLETARQRRRELEVEASLAGVPEAWRHPGKTPGDGLPQKGR